ncbi:MAG: PepSY domain-containing protein, partial [Paraglaciecola chathamensis]
RKSDWSRGGQAWGTARFLHTGEYFGVIGQSIAGLVSLIACILVYTGMLLAWRRLIIAPKQRKHISE